MIVAYYALHYGREWLYWSMRSIAPYVDKILVVYSDKPSYGFRGTIANPEKKAELQAIAAKFDADWIDFHYSGGHEGNHRDFAVERCEHAGADIILPIDHDEIWEPKHLQDAIEFTNSTTASTFRVPMQHYYRSVHWVCRDPLMPVRIIVPSGDGSEAYLPHYFGYMHHFGYAQSPRIVRYKWTIHGHQAELRPDWYEKRFLGWAPGLMDVHPTNTNFWSPAAASWEKNAYLIEDHPYFRLGIIDDRVVDGIDKPPVKQVVREAFML